MEPRPWSGETLKKLSRHIRDGTTPPSTLPSYDEVMAWYDELVDYVIKVIDAESFPLVLGDRYRKPTGRAKTVQTLRQKLQRMPTTHLPSIHDVAGVRLDISMSLTEQNAVASRIATIFGHDPSTCVQDLRKDPHAGYRAMHVLLNLPELNGRVEVQVRTELQGEWANMYEEMADLIGRDIRYGDLSADDPRRELVTNLQVLSADAIAEYEASADYVFQVRYLLDENTKLTVPEIQEAATAIRNAPKNLRDQLDRAIASTLSLEATMLGTVESLRNRIRSEAAKVRE